MFVYMNVGGGGGGVGGRVTITVQNIRLRTGHVDTAKDTGQCLWHLEESKLLSSDPVQLTGC